MFHLVLYLPFELVVMWYRTFETHEEAEEYAKTLPHGFEVTDTIPQGAIIVPLKENHAIRQQSSTSQ